MKWKKGEGGQVVSHCFLFFGSWLGFPVLLDLILIIIIIFSMAHHIFF